MALADALADARVTLTVYAGSTDTESTILTQMRPAVDRYQAVYISNVGLADLDEAFNVLGMPFFLGTAEEERAVKKKLTPLFECFPRQIRGAKRQQVEGV